jgi:hypothetical protein
MGEVFNRPWIFSSRDLFECVLPRLEFDWEFGRSCNHIKSSKVDYTLAFYVVYTLNQRK